MSPVRPLALTTLVGLLTCLAASTAFAAWPHDPYSGAVPVCTSAGLQNTPAACSDGAGGIIMAWQDFRSGNYDVYAQRVNSAGVPVWTANGVAVCTATGAQTLPELEPDGAGGAIITWADQRAANLHIYAQRVNVSGTPLWTANGVLVCAALLDQTLPRIVSDGAGGAIIAWQDFRNNVSFDIYAQRLNASGSLLWGANGVAVVLQGDAQSGVRLASDGANGAILVWDDFRGAVSFHPYAQRVSSAGAMLWTANGVAVCTAASEQRYAVITADGLGGAIVAWYDFRSSSNYDIYAQRLTSAGAALWANNGVVVCSIVGDQMNPQVVSDGAGGAFVAWEDLRNGVDVDVYLQRMTAAGNPLWTANGIAYGSGTNNQNTPELLADGLGGAILGWSDYRLNTQYPDVYAQRISGAGTAQWASGGALVSGAVLSQSGPLGVSDGAGGAVFGWNDTRNSPSTASDFYAQRIERSGQLGSPEPSIKSVKDVPADQGGQVKLSWDASYLDADPTFGVFDYRVWRSVPQSLLVSGTAALRRGTTGDPDEAVASGKLLVGAFAAQDYAWEFVGSTPSAQFASYSMVVPTVDDSIAGFNRLTAFRIEARASTSNSADRWYSAPDSGYSVDNLAPAPPVLLAAFYGAGTSRLAWNPNHEGDLAGYRLYRGTSPSFTPSAGSLVSAQPDTGFVDPAGAPYWYKLTAVDLHGNESAVVTVLPAGTLGVDGGPAAAWFASPSPNPARGGTALRFALARAGSVRIEVLDAAGRSVRVLADGGYETGEHSLRWDGRDAAGRSVAPGLYFVRVTAPDLRATRRLAVIG